MHIQYHRLRYCLKKNGINFKLMNLKETFSNALISIKTLNLNQKSPFNASTPFFYKYYNTNVYHLFISTTIQKNNNSNLYVIIIYLSLCNNDAPYLDLL